VSSKYKLAAALGVACPTVYAYLRLPDSPPVRDGYYHVAEWRKFVNRKRDVLKVSEKQQLELELLRTKLKRETHVFNEAKNVTERRIREEQEAHFLTAAIMIRDGLIRMRGELSPRFASMDARSIFKLWDEREQALFDSVCERLTKLAGATIQEKDVRPPISVVTFSQDGKMRASG
jgi:hypothetical protein